MPLVPDLPDGETVYAKGAQERSPDDCIQCEQPQEIPLCGDPAPELHAPKAVSGGGDVEQTGEPTSAGPYTFPRDFVSMNR